MSDFGDVERFARQHAACGGLTPSATTQIGGGYLLTLTCACGATFDRWVTAEEARQPLPIPPAGAPAEPVAAPPPAPAAAPAASTTPATPQAASPSPDLQAALRRALEAEAEAPRARPAPAPAREATAATGGAQPKPAPSGSLEEALRMAIAAEEAAARGPVRAPAAGAAQPGAPPATRGKIESAVREALAAQEALGGGAPPRPSSRGFWFGVLVTLLLSLAVAAWFGVGRLQQALEIGTPAPPAGPRPPTLAERERAALSEALAGLRQLQAASTPNIAYATYASRVLFAKADTDRYLRTGAPQETKDRVREVIDLHLLASAAWRARSLDDKAAWETVGQDPALDLCPAARRVVEFAEQPSNVSRAYARGVATASAIPLLWECAGERIDELERAIAAR